MARECVTHHTCDCHREKMDALEAVVARAAEHIRTKADRYQEGANEGVPCAGAIAADLRVVLTWLDDVLATRAGADAELAAVQSFVQRVNARAEARMQAGNPLEGSHWLSMQAELKAMEATRAGADAGEGRE